MRSDYEHWMLPEVAAEHDDLNRTYFEKGEAGKYPYFYMLERALKTVVDGSDGRRLSCLDVGCGAAWHAVYLSGLDIGANIAYEGLDISPHMCDRAKRNYPSGQFHVADILEFNPGRQWDLVMACGSIEHLSNWQDMLARMADLSSEWLVVHKVFFNNGAGLPTQHHPTYAGKTQLRMVVDYAEFCNVIKPFGHTVVQRYDWDTSVSCIVARRKHA